MNRFYKKLADAEQSLQPGELLIAKDVAFDPRYGGAIKRYYVFPSLEEFLIYQEGPHRHHYYEVISNGPQRIYFDIDIPISEITYLCNLYLGTGDCDVGVISDEFIDIFVNFLRKEYPDVKINIYTSHIANKYSYHIVLINQIVKSNLENKKVATELVRKFQNQNPGFYDEMAKFVDLSLYKTNQLFRLLGSTKIESNNLKVLYKEDMPGFQYSLIGYGLQIVDKLFFTITSGNQYPGKGPNEYINPDNKNKYEKLSNIQNWRQKLTNFYPFQFYYNGRNYLSVEHAYQAEKISFNLNDSYQLSLDSGSKISTMTAKDIKEYGRNYRMTKEQIRNWDLRRKDVMEKILYAKFFEYSDVQDSLLNTLDAELYTEDKGQISRADILEKVRYQIGINPYILLHAILNDNDEVIRLYINRNNIYKVIGITKVGTKIPTLSYQILQSMDLYPDWYQYIISGKGEQPLIPDTLWLKVLLFAIVNQNDNLVTQMTKLFKSNFTPIVVAKIKEIGKSNPYILNYVKSLNY